MFFYSQLENLCKIKGIKPSNLVESLGMSKGTMSNWKKGGTPNADAVVRIAEHFGVTTDYLLTGKETSSIPISQEDKEWLFRQQWWVISKFRSHMNFSRNMS